MAAPVLSFPEKAGQGCPALAVVAAAKLAGVELELKPLDAKTAKDAPVALTFASGCATMPGEQAGPSRRLLAPLPRPWDPLRSIEPAAAPQGGAGGRAQHPALRRPRRSAEQRPVRLRCPVRLPGAPALYMNGLFEARCRPC